MSETQTVAGHSATIEYAYDLFETTAGAPPRPSSRERLRAFAQRNQCTVNYTMAGGGMHFLPNGTIRRL